MSDETPETPVQPEPQLTPLPPMDGPVKSFLDAERLPEREEKPEPDEQMDLLQKLRGLWKGTLYTTIYTLYTALIGWLLVWIDWRAALLAFFAISVSHPLRYIVNSVDKIGWEMGDKPDKHGVRAYQQRLFWGLYSVITVCNLFLVIQAYFVSDAWPAVGVFIALAVVEFLFHQIRSLNRKIEYAYADYGRS